MTPTSGGDVVVGSRRHPNSTFHVPAKMMGYINKRRVQSWVFSRLVSWLLPVGFRDTQCETQGTEALALAALLPHLRCDGFAFDCEILLRACRPAST